MSGKRGAGSNPTTSMAASTDVGSPLPEQAASISPGMFHPRAQQPLLSSGAAGHLGPLGKRALQTDVPARRPGQNRLGPASGARPAPPSSPPLLRTLLHVVGRGSSPNRQDEALVRALSQSWGQMPWGAHKEIQEMPGWEHHR